MNIRRIVALGATALIPFLSACNSTSTSTTPSQIATDVNLISTGLSAAVASIAAIPGVDPTQLATLQADLKIVQTDAATVAAATAAPTSTVQEIVSTIDALAPIALALVPGGSALVPVIDAATSLAPALLADLGVSGVTSAALPVHTAYTPAQARALLATGAH
jgi:hypothetical protein